MFHLACKVNSFKWKPNKKHSIIQFIFKKVFLVCTQLLLESEIMCFLKLIKILLLQSTLLQFSFGGGGCLSFIITFQHWLAGCVGIIIGYHNYHTLISASSYSVFLFNHKIDSLINYFTDEQERVQKKTFTNWMNTYLKQVTDKAVVVVVLAVVER